MVQAKTLAHAVVVARAAVVEVAGRQGYVASVHSSVGLLGVTWLPLPVMLPSGALHYLDDDATPEDRQSIEAAPLLPALVAMNSADLLSPFEATGVGNVSSLPFLEVPPKSRHESCFQPPGKSTDRSAPQTPFTSRPSNNSSLRPLAAALRRKLLLYVPLAKGRSGMWFVHSKR